MPDLIQAETRLSYFMDLFGDRLNGSSSQKATYEVQVDREVLATIKIEDADGGKEEIKTVKLFPGDTLNLVHTFTLKGELSVKDNHPFPIKLDFKGQTYYLKKTKADKLILTK
jgi:hypothetical protein